MTDFITANKKAWDRQAESRQAWSTPVDSKTILDAKQGNWEIHLTPTPLPKEWLGDIKEKRILCLASAGGQQAPVLAAAGAFVTVFDLSEKQLEQDKLVAIRDDLQLDIVQGDMRSLHMFADETFDLIFHPISNLYIPDVNPVWQECYRVLKSNGKLLASFYNPIVFIGERGKQENQEAFVFGHSLTDLIGGQTKIGFNIVDFYEDWQPKPRFVIDNFLPTFLATLAVKKS